MAAERIHWPFALKDELIAEQGGKCWVCGEPCSFEDFARGSGQPGNGRLYPSFEHKVPLAAGGEDARHNLAISHSGCNNDRNCAPTTSAPAQSTQAYPHTGNSGNDETDCR